MDGGRSEQQAAAAPPIFVRHVPDSPDSIARRLATWNCALVSMVVHLAVLILLGLVVCGKSGPGTRVLALTAAPHETEDSPVDLHGAVEVAAGVLSRDQEDVAGELIATVERTPDASEDAIRAAERLDLDFSAALDVRGDLTARGRGGGADRGDEGTVQAAFVERLARVEAKTGDVQISLLWSNYNDIDLHVVCPSGEHIYFGRRASRCGGELDVDMNVPPRESRRPVENVFWPAGGAPAGEYLVLVDHYRNHRQKDPTEFDVRVEVDGEAQYFHNRITFGNNPIVIYRFRRK
jgi:hypothetical protein